MSVFIPIPKKGHAKECSNYHMIALISHTSKVMIKILQSRFQQYMNWELPDVRVGFRKGRGTRDKVDICLDHRESKGVEKNDYFCFTDYTNTFVWITKTEKFLKRWDYQAMLPVPWEICMQVKKQELVPDMEQQTGSNWERSMTRLYIITLLV